MCLGHEGGALMSEISVLKKEVPQSSLTPSTMWVDTEKEPAMNQEKTLTKMQTYWLLEPRFPRL